MKKSRFLYLHEEVNPSKLAALGALQDEYTAYLNVCCATMLDARRFNISLKDKQRFFPVCKALSSQIVKNVRDHAIAIVSGWAASKYQVRLRNLIKTKFKDGEINEDTRSALCILGKRLVDQPSGKVTQEALDLYWSWLLDEEIVGRPPSISNRCGMRMSEMTAVLGASDDTTLTCWWLGFSRLESGKSRIQLPLVANPYVKKVNDVSKGILARKDKKGRWRFEVVEKRDWESPKPAPDAHQVGVDVGLNVMAATSDGRLLGASLKPKFNKLYDKLQTLRGNRQRQELKVNSKRLDCLESKLTGMVKTIVGGVANKLVQYYPATTFIIEDLDLRGCRGQKRFAYSALHHSLSMKAPVLVVNPAYTSQSCPSCGYISRSNRTGVKFHCRSCGRKGHADVMGARGILGRSVDKSISCDDQPSVVKVLLRKRYLQRRDSPSRELLFEPVPSGRRLTTDAPQGVGTASNRGFTQ